MTDPMANPIHANPNYGLIMATYPTSIETIKDTTINDKTTEYLEFAAIIISPNKMPK